MAEKAPEEETVYVEVILKAHVAERLDNGVAWEYWVKWYGHDDEKENTWETHDDLSATCDCLLTSFWKEIGIDNDDYPPGYTVTPSEDWIKKEKEYFQRILQERDDTSEEEEVDDLEQPDVSTHAETQSRKGSEVDDLGQPDVSTQTESRDPRYYVPPWDELRPFGLRTPPSLSLTEWGTKHSIPSSVLQFLASLDIEGPQVLRGWQHRHLLAIGLQPVAAAIVCDSLDRWEHFA